MTARESAPGEERKPILLLVDDTPASLTSLVDVLSNLGYELHTATNGADALGEASRLQPDLILLDVMMPDMDGFEVCRRLRRDPDLAEVPVIMVTTLDDRASRVEGIEAGADDFVAKPFDRVELRARVKTIVGLNRFRRLWQERSKVEHLIAFSPDGIAVVDATGKISVANPALERLLETGGLVGSSFWNIVTPEHLSECVACFLNVMEQEAVEFVSTELVSADGTHVPVEISAGYCHWDGTPSCELVIRDITARRVLEEQLRQAQKLETIGQLTSGIAHDFNNILSVVLTNTELLEGALAAGAESARRDLDDITAAARSGANMIRKLMGLSRTADLRRVPTDIAAVTADLNGILRRLFPATIHIEIKADDVVPVVRADAGAVQQMLMNLATNARDAMPTGGTFSISVQRESVDDEERANDNIEAGDYAVLRVRDTGTGMDAETKARLFEPFFTTKGPEKGTGLGMAMIFGLMDQHQGFIDVQSSLGHGTTISLYFPAISEVVAAPITSDGPATMAGGSETILLAEDEPTLRRSGRRVLEKLGYRVLIASDGEEALEVFREHRDSIDLILSDVMMPNMDGGTLMRAVHEIKPGIRFLFASGYAASDLDGDLTSVPMLPKPWTVSEIAAQVRLTLDHADNA